MSRHRPADVVEPLIPDDDAPVPPARRPTWWRVRQVRAIAFVCVGLSVALSLLAAFVAGRAVQATAAHSAAVERRLSVLEDDLAERVRQRDEERDAAAARDAEMRERFAAYLCEVLAQQPDDSPALDRLRVTLGCAEPGTPPAAATAPGPGPPSAEAGAPPASPSPSRSRPDSPTPGPPATPDRPPAPEPGQPDPDPLGELLCNLVPSC